MGLFTAACFLRTGNAVFVIIPHFVNDVIAGMDIEAYSGNLILNGEVQFSNYIDIGLMVLTGAIGLYLIRKSKHDEIIKLWDSKFGRIDE